MNKERRRGEEEEEEEEEKNKEGSRRYGTTNLEYGSLVLFG